MSANSRALKEHQPSISIAEQIDNLRMKGLIIEDEDFARATLSDISYFRLIKAYSLGFKSKNGDYNEKVCFEDILQLYLFDSNLRHALFPLIEKIEINLRCRLVNYFCDRYGIFGYQDIGNFTFSAEKFRTFYDEIQNEINRSTRSPFIKNFRQNYESSEVPLYALIEIISFGTLSKFYKGMKNEDKKAIAFQYGVGYTYLESWIESLSYVRNICAHYGRLYNAKLTKTPRLYKQYIEKNISNYRIFATLLTLKHILQNDKQWHDFVQTIGMLIDKYPSVNLNCVGFPQDWAEVLVGSDLTLPLGASEEITKISEKEGVAVDSKNIVETLPWVDYKEVFRQIEERGKAEGHMQIALNLFARRGKDTKKTELANTLRDLGVSDEIIQSAIKQYESELT